MRMIDYVCTTTMEYIDHMPKGKRKKSGQFFTSKETAVFMAGLFSIPQNSDMLRILDPGAGSGILSTAIIERLDSIATIDKIELTCYENDSGIIDLLNSNLEWVSKHSKKKVSYKVIMDNYILCQENEYNYSTSPESAKFDIIIGNPPYMKISKNAPEAIAMHNVCYGAPNMYFLFAAMSMFNLKEEGEMVYIIPRSWTSGAYFKQFREYFLTEGVLEHIHLFISRDKVFEEEKVLQETIIIKAKKIRKKPKMITVTTTQNNSDFSNRTVFEAPYSTVIGEKNFYVYLITNIKEAETLKRINYWSNTLPDIGLKMKTGITVDFRNREALRDYAGEDTVPLFYSQHIQNGEVVFPVGKEHEYIVTEKNGLLQENSNYLFVKRFTTKEEHRRLQCGVYLANKYPEYKKISTQNKINFIAGTGKLSEYVVYGLYVLFNSKIYDDYYRILNGSTQVNSSEINSMPIPPMDAIEAMGKDLIRIRDMSEMACDSILRNYIWAN